MYRPITRLAAVITLLPVVASCGHDSPTTPASRSAELTVHATTLASFSNGTIGVVVSYRQQGDQLVAVAAKPSSIPIVRGALAQQSVEVDLAPCLGDSKRVDAAQPGCPVVVELELRNASGALVDRRDASPPNRVLPGQTADMPAVALTEIKSVTITPPTSSSLHPGETVQLTAAVRASDGSVVSDHPVSWSTSSAATATVNAATGEVTAVAPGAVTITATVGEKTDQTAFTIVSLVASVTLSPSPVYLDWNDRTGHTATVTVAAFDASGAPISDLTGRSIVWASDDTTTVTIAATEQPAKALVTDVWMGKTTISATVDGVKGTAPLEAQAGGWISGLTNTNQIPPLSVGESVPVRLFFTDENGAVVGIDDTMPGARSWTSENPAVATVSATGVVTGVALGETVIDGTYRGITVRNPVFVVPVAKIEVYISPKTLRVGETVQAYVIVSDPQGEMLRDQVVTWRTAPTGQASVASVDQYGRVTGLKTGVTQVIASVDGKEGSIEVPVLPEAVASVRMSPTQLRLNVGETGTLSATPLNADNLGLQHDVTWTTANPAVAAITGTVSGAAGGAVGSTASIKGIGYGNTTIVATSDGKSATVGVWVFSVPPVATVNLDPSTLELNIGAVANLVAIPRDANGVALTGRAITWTTMDPSVATVTGTGSVTAVSGGVATIVATSEGVSGSAIVTVSAPAAAPNAPSVLTISPGRSAPFTYSNNLTWQDNSNDEDEFHVERAVGGTDNFTLNARVPGSNNARGASTDADNFTELTLYTYRVRACKAGVCSAPSDPATIPGALREPTNVVAVSEANGVRLTWQDNSSREDGYTVSIWIVNADGTAVRNSTFSALANATQFFIVGGNGSVGTTLFYQVVAYARVPGYGYVESWAANSQRITF